MRWCLISAILICASSAAFAQGAGAGSGGSSDGGAGGAGGSGGTSQNCGYIRFLDRIDPCSAMMNPSTPVLVTDLIPGGTTYAQRYYEDSVPAPVLSPNGEPRE